MRDLFTLVNELKDRIKRYERLLKHNEMLTRYVLVDPVLRALGWDTENPSIVRPEEKQNSGKPDYILYYENEKLIALEAKSLGSKLDEKKVLDLGFKYSWKNKIPYFIITDGNEWRVYNVAKMGGQLILEINILNDAIEDVVRQLLSLWRPLIRRKIEPLGIIQSQREKSKEHEVLDLDKVKEFYESLTDMGKAFLEVVFKAWKQGRTLTKDEIIDELRKRGINIDRRVFTGIKSGITRRSEKMNLPPPMPTSKESGERYWRKEKERYVLRDEWGRALEKILFKDESR